MTEHLQHDEIATLNREHHELYAGQIAHEGMHRAYEYTFRGFVVHSVETIASVYGPLVHIYHEGYAQPLIIARTVKVDVRPKQWVAYAHDTDPRTGDIHVGRVLFVDDQHEVERLPAWLCADAWTFVKFASC